MKRSSLVIPGSIVIHLGIINTVLLWLTPGTYLNPWSILYYNTSWLLIAYGLNFYPTGRKERFLTNLPKLFKQYLIFGLAYFAFFALMRLNPILIRQQINVFIILCTLLILSRATFYTLRRLYRIEGGNFVNVVVIGRDKNLSRIRKVFDEPGLGYRYKGYFANEPSTSATYLGPFKDSLDYILQNNIDQIYCMVSQLNQEDLRTLIRFADNNFKKLKIIPDNKEIYTRAMSIELYGTIPVLNMRELPLDKEYKRAVKRTFDIVFSSMVILLILSWLTPLMFILMRMDSKGKLFFKQKRHGVNRKVFWCYKFRSMSTASGEGSLMTSANDMRITKLGRFLRRTSLDELPQFYNVLFGDMSVVGPRPHVELQTGEYQTSVDKYLVRHFVKPGITGLAQVKGYRGEIMRKADIINRVRLDVFYVEKWSLLMDIDIIVQTVRNVMKGDAKAY